MDPAPAHVHGPGCDHSADRPIGWWLKHVDRLLESSMDRVLAGEGVGRRHWQALNAIAGGADTETALEGVLGTVLSPPRDGTRQVLDQLRARRWVQEIAGRLRLTPEGATARGRLVAAIRDHRARSTDGVSAEETAATIAVLRRMAQNLS